MEPFLLACVMSAQPREADYMQKSEQPQRIGLVEEKLETAKREVERGRVVVRTRVDDEVILQLAWIAVINKVNSGVYVAIVDLVVIRDIREPFVWIVPDQIVTLSKAFAMPCHFSLRIPGNEPHGDDCIGMLVVTRHIEGSA